MKDSPWHLNALERATQLAFNCLPSPKPSKEQLQGCKIVGHRGAHAGTAFLENTLPGFQALVDAGVWGIEMDIRWTTDLVPVISHDADCLRVFNNPTVIAETPFAQLRQQVPLVPSLEEVVAEIGGRIHLMLEIKSEPYRHPIKQSQKLEQVLSNLSPGEDFHLLALDRNLLSLANFAPLASQLLVSITNTKLISEQALTLNYGGIAGAYPFYTQKIRRKHQAIKQKIGVGHIDSKRLLFQEINKNTDWIFSNRALELQQMINKEVNI